MRDLSGQLVGRYISYLVAILPFGIGIFMVAFDKKKQGLHDKLSRTVVIREKNRGPDRVEFRNK